MTYEVPRRVLKSEEEIAERVNELLINDLGYSTEDFLFVAEGEGQFSLTVEDGIDDDHDFKIGERVKISAKDDGLHDGVIIARDGDRFRVETDSQSMGTSWHTKDELTSKQS
jgi:hypothetical protein